MDKYLPLILASWLQFNLDSTFSKCKWARFILQVLNIPHARGDFVLEQDLRQG